MELIVPEILDEGRHLSVGLLLGGLAIGLALWGAGWWSYRFWVALATTVTAGIIGLYEAPFFQMQPLLAAILLAIAAGVLALALMRMAAFVAAGIICVGLIKIIAPSVEAPWVCFLSGGIIATILFRLWMMVMTSFGGTMLMAYCGMCLLDLLAVLECVRASQDHAVLLNWIVGGGTALGTLLQFIIFRRVNRKESKDDDEDVDPRLLRPMRFPKSFRRAA